MRYCFGAETRRMRPGVVQGERRGGGEGGQGRHLGAGLSAAGVACLSADANTELQAHSRLFNQ